MSEELRKGIPKARVIKKGRPLTPEEQKVADEKMDRVLREFGVIDKDESVADWREERSNGKG